MVILVIFMGQAHAMGDSLGAGKALAQEGQASSQALIEKESKDFKLLNESGICVNEHPKEATLSPTQLKELADKKMKEDEIVQAIAENQNKREKIVFTESDRSATAINALKNQLGPDGSTAKPDNELVTCEEPGEAYHLSCARERHVSITVVPPEYRRVKKTRVIKKKAWLSGNKIENYEEDELVHPKRVVTTDDHWLGCEAEEKLHDEGHCVLAQEVLGADNQTRFISGEPVTKDHWSTVRTYKCGVSHSDIKNPCTASLMGDCTKIETRCKETVKDASTGRSICKVYTHIYRCVKGTLTLPPETSNPEGYCLNGDCVPTVQKQNTKIFEAISRLELLKQLQKQTTGTTVSLFKGDIKSCTTNFGGGFKDCCSRMKGFGMDMKVAKECSSEERELADARSQGRCVAIGSFVKNKVLGVNTSKAQTFCVFPSRLARVFQEQARKQLGMGWGTPQNPDCRGLTLEELQRVNLSQMNLGEAYTDLAGRIKNTNAAMKDLMAQKQKDFSQGESRELVGKLKERQEQIRKGNSKDVVY